MDTRQGNLTDEEFRILDEADNRVYNLSQKRPSEIGETECCKNCESSRLITVNATVKRWCVIHVCETKVFEYCDKYTSMEYFINRSLKR
jgi:hypothetical protein